MAGRKPVQGSKNDSPDNGNLSTITTATSRRNQAIIPIILFPLGLITIGTCICTIFWLLVHGPVLVPGQDTRIPAIIISVGGRLSRFFINAAIIRSAWAALLPTVLARDAIPNQVLVGICRSFMSLGQLKNYNSLPASFKYHIILAVYISLAMSFLPASFQYVELPSHGFALVPDVASLCNQSLLNLGETGYSCDQNLTANTTTTSWSYLQDANTGGQNIVQRFGELGDEVLGVNITLAIILAGWTLGQDNELPWMSMWVSYQTLLISANSSGANLSAIFNIYMDGSLLDSLDIANTPQWNSVVHLYQQVNKSGFISSLSPWIVVALARDLEGGTANFGGLALDAVEYLGATYLDLPGYSSTQLQDVLGAAAWCQFNGSTGGTWPEELWAPLNHTTNVVIGIVVDDRPIMGTAMLNYGPGLQYSPVPEETSLDGGSVLYIANNAEPGVSFPALFSLYIRNQWSLMAYSIARQSGQQVSLPFAGLSPNKLYISPTSVTAIPFSALFIGLVITLRASFCTIRERHWVNRVEFKSWWLVKALQPDMYHVGNSNATEKDFI
jgi:hypothetical protein